MSASDRELGALHKQVALTLTDAIKPTEDGMPPAAYLGAAIAFLKNNNITASVTENTELAGLAKALAAKRQDKKLSMLQLQEAEQEFEKFHGGNLQ